MFSDIFIGSPAGRATFDKDVPAPYLRKAFVVNQKLSSANITICGLGFYRLFISGLEITKGFLSSYRCNPDHIRYYDCYDITAYLSQGKNAIGIILGNGLLNYRGGAPWQFDKATFVSAPKTALHVSILYENGEDVSFQGDSGFKTTASPILNDDIMYGETYDARNEIDGWCTAGFDDSGWDDAELMQCPAGEAVICDVEPIIAEKEMTPVKILKASKGWIFDFGENNSGVCRINIEGIAGQTLTLSHGEFLENGELYRKNLGYSEKDLMQKDIYICKNGGQSHIPSFTYHGFRYVLVEGLQDFQATEKLLTFLVFHSKLEARGHFTCSDETINLLQEMTRRSTLSNFHHYPTDCPQREKNGWTGDVALSAEHMLLNLNPEQYFKEWLRSVRKEQNDCGALPGIVPTGGWGYDWPSGPSWDGAIIEVPYYTYLYRGDTEIILQNSHAMMRYIEYMATRIEENGLLCYGLGDWCQPARPADKFTTPITVTDTFVAIWLCKMAETMFNIIGRALNANFAHKLRKKLLFGVQNNLIDQTTGTPIHKTQTALAMALFWDILQDDKKQQAAKELVALIEKNDNHIDTGVLGARVIFHVLSKFGFSEIALKMILNPTFPSYYNWIARGATTLWEDFQPVGGDVNSRNHHFWGDISGWFIKSLAGIRFELVKGKRTVNIAPSFNNRLSHAYAWHQSPEGRIECEWSKEDDSINLEIRVPQSLIGEILLEKGYVFRDRTFSKSAISGSYKIIRDI